MAETHARSCKARVAVGMVTILGRLSLRYLCFTRLELDEGHRSRKQFDEDALSGAAAFGASSHAALEAQCPSDEKHSAIANRRARRRHWRCDGATQESGECTAQAAVVGT